MLVGLLESSAPQYVFDLQNKRCCSICLIPDGESTSRYIHQQIHVRSTAFALSLLPPVCFIDLSQSARSEDCRASLHLHIEPPSVPTLKVESTCRTFQHHHSIVWHREQGRRYRSTAMTTEMIVKTGFLHVHSCITSDTPSQSELGRSTPQHVHKVGLGVHVSIDGCMVTLLEIEVLDRSCLGPLLPFP